ncbi:glycoside hydrolase family 130 protein [Sphingomonas sp. 10B4]|uniref:glycoside hydrolase family 130 protein n=1 Tax=Sphingomonas sp. 10B4 TaxID=3048575 RepID=UPI002AB459D4|nr:glycoside hydrolase family 130 protein [Sphingomonas sp. 10B4]MDY7523413.1 glycoside hydrolase family 130 protein [Sphingomonas sp. 10B4]MEB0281111.1 glycoside hydrolase family 130 protein [Sphingomonas sp. 10B4]
MPDAYPILDHADVILRPDPSRTVVRPFSLEYPKAFQVEGQSRTQAIVDRVMTLDAAGLAAELAITIDSLDERHRDVDAMLVRRYEEIAATLAERPTANTAQQRLIGAYFSEEYSYEAAALFNPSAVLAHDQSTAPEGGVRFIVSLRGIGEGHVSSVAFRSGSWVPGGRIAIDPPSLVAVPPIIEGDSVAAGAVVTLRVDRSRDISETVLFPVLPSQHQGIEDLRLVRFTEDDGTTTYHGTYTAFSGSTARPELLSGDGSETFIMRALTGDAAGAKGMALFPRRVGGQYVMLGRQDSESIWLHRSDDILHWEGGGKIVSPRYPWEYVQMGNCGSPIEVDEGWLVFTHGVGTVRNYCVGACLLDKADPSKLLARTPEPILRPSPDERDGYVPNVVYSCGALALGRDILLPYGVADNFTAFATTTVDRLLSAME